MLAKRNTKPPKELVDNYKKWAQLQDDMGQTILKLMAHPECTLEQLWVARLQYTDNIAEFNDMRRQLREAFWDGPYYTEKYPWNN